MFRAAGPEEMRPVGEVEFVNGIAAMSASGQYGKTRVCEAIIGWADLMLGAGCARCWRPRSTPAAAAFAACATAHPTTTGVAGKFVSRTMPPHRLLDPKFREGFAELGKLGLTFDSWHFHPQLPDLVDLARAFPGQTIIVDHVGGVLGVGQYAGKSAEIMPAGRRACGARQVPQREREAGRARHDVVRLRFP